MTDNPVPTERLGRSGLTVSRLCLGTMMFGGRTSEAEAATIIDQARDWGVNFVDTADVYNGGESERIVGRAIAKDRDDWVLATKLANPMGDGANRRGTGRKWMAQACDESLGRLGTDYIDLYYLHREDFETPLEEIGMAMADLMRHGKVRYFGVSNYRSWRLASLCHICEGLGIQRPIASQPYYNAMNRMPEVEHLPACGHFGLGAVPYSPLARGVLTGKYKPGEAPPDGTRAGSGDKRIMQSEWREESLVIAQQISGHAEKRGITPGQFALAWVLNNGFVSAVIAGPRTMEQWQAYRGGVDYAFTEEDEALIDSLVPAGHPSTPGYTDPQYPLEGRKTRHVR
ncbi:MAG: aldo/keto reductase [Pseudomonadota bacterium]